MKDITICIPCAEAHEELKTCLDSIEKFGFDRKPRIIVAIRILKNHSSVAAVCEKSPLKPEFFLVEGGTNVARNELIKRVDTELTLFLGCDIIIMHAGWLETWIAEHGDLDISNCVVKLPDGTLDCSGFMYTPINRHMFQHKVEIPFAIGDYMMIRTELAKNCPFDQTFQLGYGHDETDWINQVRWQMRHPIMLIPNVMVMHNKHSSFRNGILKPEDSFTNYKVFAHRWSGVRHLAYPGMVPAFYTTYMYEHNKL